MQGLHVAWLVSLVSMAMPACVALRFWNALKFAPTRTRAHAHKNRKHAQSRFETTDAQSPPSVHVFMPRTIFFQHVMSLTLHRFVSLFHGNEAQVPKKTLMWHFRQLL
jgi:hypothetical protein